MEHLLTLHHVPPGVAPLYERIAAEVRRRVDGGIWGSGQQLRSESDLAADLGVARGTLRKALAALVAAGYVVQHHGVGTFIAPRQSAATIDSFLSLAERMTLAGVEHETVVISCERRAAGLWGAPPEAGPAIRLWRLRSARGRPVSALANCVPVAVAPSLGQIELDGRSLYQCLEQEFGVRLGRSDLTFSARAADDDLAKLLDVAAGTPLTHLSQVTFAADDKTVVDVAETWIRPDRHQPTVSLWRSS